LHLSADTRIVVPSPIAMAAYKGSNGCICTFR